LSGREGATGVALGLRLFAVVRVRGGEGVRVLRGEAPRGERRERRGWRFGRFARLVGILVLVGLTLAVRSDASVAQNYSFSGRFFLEARKIVGHGLTISLSHRGGRVQLEFGFDRAEVYGLKLSGVSRAPGFQRLQAVANERAGVVELQDMKVDVSSFRFAVSGGCLRVSRHPLDVTLSNAALEATRMSAAGVSFPGGAGGGPALSVSAGFEPIAGQMPLIGVGQTLKDVNSTLEGLAAGGICGDGGQDVSAPQGPVPKVTRGEIPPDYLAAYRDAAKRYGLDWSILAAIGQIESNHGEGGKKHICVLGPYTAYGSAVGPMQFLPSTWQRVKVDADGDGVADPCDYRDAIFGAAKYLRENGAPQDYMRAIFAYNHSWQYVREVLALAAAYRRGVPVQKAPPAGGGSYDCDPTRELLVGADEPRLTRISGNGRAVFPLPRRYFDSYTDSWGASRPQNASAGASSMHEGIDLMAPKGTPIYSVTSGTVEPVAGGNRDGWNYLGGWAIMIRADHDVGPIHRGDELYYAHMERPSALRPGDHVRVGELIGHVGDSGQGPEGTAGLFPPHLHFGWYDPTGRRAQVPSGAMNPYPLLNWLRQNGGVARGGRLGTAYEGIAHTDASCPGRYPAGGYPAQGLPVLTSGGGGLPASAPAYGGAKVAAPAGHAVPGVIHTSSEPGGHWVVHHRVVHHQSSVASGGSGGSEVHQKAVVKVTGGDGRNVSVEQSAHQSSSGGATTGSSSPSSRAKPAPGSSPAEGDSAGESLPSSASSSGHASPASSSPASSASPSTGRTSRAGGGSSASSSSSGNSGSGSPASSSPSSGSRASSSPTSSSPSSGSRASSSPASSSGASDTSSCSSSPLDLRKITGGGRGKCHEKGILRDLLGG